MKRLYYVYLLVDPRSDEPFYAGKGHGARMYSHLSEAKRPPHRWSNVLKCERIQSILRDNCTPTYRVVSTGVTEEQSFLIERNLIAKHGRIIDNTGTLTNMRSSHYHHHSNIPERKYKSQPVVQYSRTGTPVNTFPSAIAAADSIGKNKTSILQNCHGIRHSAYGYVWRFENDKFSLPPKEIEYHVNRRKAVRQIKDGKLIATFDSIKQAAEITNINHGNICRCCKNPRRSAGGYYWEYCDR